MSRRLPVYLLLDTSGSMSGEPIEQVKNGVQMLVAALRQDPYALETAWLSVITFGSSAQVAVPLTELTAFQPPTISATGGTSMGDALATVATCVGKDLMKTTPTTKGDWKPMVFIMTDGGPTDDWQKGLARFKKEKWGVVVACAVDNGDETVLKQITEIVVRLNTSDSASIKAFFKWISASVSQGSKSVEQAGKEVQGLNELPPPPPEIKVVT
jgi:uncharacterized protein YegL